MRVVRSIMSLQSLFFISLNIEAIVMTVFLLIFLYLISKLFRELRLTNQRLVEAAAEGKQAASAVKLFIGKIGSSVTDYFATKIISVLRNKNHKDN